MPTTPEAQAPPARPPVEVKAALRRQCAEIRQALRDDYRRQASQRICERIRAWVDFPASGTVLTYLAMKAEVDLRPLIAAAPAIRWAIPRVVETPSHHLVFHDYDPERLIRHRFGMLEPDPALPPIEPEQASLIIVPGLAYTRAGYRLGYGGGYYDRLLAAPGHAPSLGACFQALLLADIPHEAHDRPVDFVVTEATGVLAAGDG